MLFFWGKGAQTQDAELLLDDLGRPDNLAAISDAGPVFVVNSNRRSRYLSGWRFGIVGAIVLGISVLAVNLGLTIWVTSNFPVVNGAATVYEGSCEKSKNSTTWIHLGINILGTLLLGASNYCMQILCAPTREEINAAHAKQVWLSTGVASLKNLFYIDRRKFLLWTVLGLSSVPLHLLWNSAVIDTLSSNNYIYGAATENFLNGTSINPLIPIYYSEEAQTMRDKYQNGSLLNMSSADCILNYSLDYISEYGNVILIYDNAGANTSMLYLSDHEVDSVVGSKWVCGRDHNCDPMQLSQRNATHWNPWKDFDVYNTVWSSTEQNSPDSLFFEDDVKYCLAEKYDHPCRLRMSPPILITVLVCNAFKTVCFVMVLWVVGSGFPLVTNGDVVESFLLRPDPEFRGRCLASKATFKKEKSFWSAQYLPLQWRGKKRRWAAGASKGVWVGTFIPASALIIAIVAICLQGGIWRGGTAKIVASGFGKPSVTYLIGAGLYGPQRSPVTASLLANLPQLVVSYIYVAYNSLFTSMLATSEWVGYSISPRGLRVTWPRGHQRSRAFLQLPYIYAIPIMTASTLLHWLISQSLFLVSITIYDTGGKEWADARISTVGFSPYATIFAICMGGAMLLAVLLVGIFRTYPGTIPLAACCSASIAAACQPQQGEVKDELAFKKLKWGVVDRSPRRDGDETFEHASFSAREVAPLVAGLTYA